MRIGANLGEVALYHDETLITTALFCVAVRPSLQDEGTTIPEDESPTLIELIEKYSGGSGGNVLSVNGKTGDVVISANDVGADTAGTASELVSFKPGEKCEGKTFSIPTGETDGDGNAIYEEKTAGIGTERFNAVILGELTSDNKRDFTNYPFCIYQMGQLAALFTETAGTYTLKVESLGTVVVPLDSRFMPAGYATEEFVTNAINAALYVDSESEVG